MKKYYLIQAFVLFVGTIVSWLAVNNDFARFYGLEGTIFKIGNCVSPNPILTPCFYGAIGFLGAFVFSVFLLSKERIDQKIRQERYLSLLLFGGTIFGFSNFAKLCLDYFQGSQIGCSGNPMANPFFTPCFYGSVIFLSSLLVSQFILWKEKKGYR